MGKRDLKPMVAEDDPEFARFWNAYPYRVSKKDARHAWTQIGPSLELVDRMLATLAWQAPLWEKQGYGMPYPASWLRAERWTDEAPRAMQPQKAFGTAAELVLKVVNG